MHFFTRVAVNVCVAALSLSAATAQTTVQISAFPQDFQLYQRGSNNVATVPVMGTAPSPYAQVSLKILRRATGTVYYYQKQRLNTGALAGSFSFTPTLRVEAIEYDFYLYAHTSATDSVLVGKRERIVCGDLLILYGQSNVIALHDIDGYGVDDRLLRNYMYPFQSTDIPNQLSWSVARQPYGTVGGIGIWLQKLILENFGIPTCVINGGVGGTPINELSARDPNDHANLNTPYGLLLYRARRAGLAETAPVIVYKQGEADAAYNTENYDVALRKLTDQFEEDYPGVKKIYVSQLNIISDPTPRSGQVRDAQRRAAKQKPLIEAIATVGTPYYDGVHYTRPGNQQIATELFRQIARDIYGAKDTVQINSPNIQKAVFNSRRDTITLFFEEQMRMVWPKDTTLHTAQGVGYTRRLIDFIYLDGKAGAVTAGFARQNQIVLALREPSVAKTITYLPPFYADQYSPFYDGVHLTNTRGLRAFTFDSFPLATPDTPKQPQSITFLPVASQSFSNAPITLTARSSANLPVTFQVVSGPGQLINSHQLRPTGAGRIIIRATQAGDEYYLSAPNVQQAIAISKGSQTIDESVKITRLGPLTLFVSATASSRLPVRLTVVDGPATLTDSVLTEADLGRVTLHLSQPGDDRYLPASDLIKTICINADKPVISTDPVSALTLISSSPLRNQWFLNGTALPGETGQKVMVKQTGNYVVAVSNPVPDCQSVETSEPKSVLILSVQNDPASTSLQIYPNPATDQVLVRLNTPTPGDAPVLQLFDGSGRSVFTPLPLDPSLHTFSTSFSVRSLKSGVYLLRVTTTNGSWVARLLIQP